MAAELPVYFRVDASNDSLLLDRGARIPHGLFTQAELQAFALWASALYDQDLRAFQPSERIKLVPMHMAHFVEAARCRPD